MKATAVRMRWASLAAVLILLAACTTSTQTMSRAEIKEAAVYADQAVDSLMAALQNSDYAAFSADFTDLMKSSLDERQMLNLKQTLDSKLGKYLGWIGPSGKRNAQFLILAYTLRYEKDPETVLRITFTTSTPHQIAGLVFDAPELQGD